MRIILYLLIAQLGFAVLQVYWADRELDHLNFIATHLSELHGRVVEVSAERTKTTRRISYVIALGDGPCFKNVRTPGYLCDIVGREYRVGDTVSLYSAEGGGYLFIPQMQEYYANSRQRYVYVTCIAACLCFVLSVCIFCRKHSVTERNSQS